MNKKIFLFLFLLFIPIAASALTCGNITSPQHNRTYPYSTGLSLRTEFEANVGNCTYTLAWLGDESEHGDEIYPDFTYDSVSIDCDSLESGLRLDVDFDGEYTINVSADKAGSPCSDQNTFFVDRSELDGSKIIGAMLFPFLLLAVLLALYLVGQNLPVLLPNKYFKITSLLYSVLIIIMSPFIVSNATLVLNEFIKNPMIADSSYTTIIILLWVGVFLFTLLFMIRLLIIVIDQLKKIKVGGRKLV